MLIPTEKAGPHCDVQKSHCFPRCSLSKSPAHGFSESMARKDVLGSYVGRRRDRNKFPEDVFGHLNVVVGNDQSFLNVLVGVALTHEALNLT